MDQLRKVLGWLKRQHFWVLSVLVAVIAAGCWWKAAGQLSKQFDDNKKMIEAEFTSLKGLRANPFHPNDDVNKRQAEETNKQAADVERIWQQLYDRQSEGVLVWPASLSQRFRDYVEKLPFGAEIPPDLCDNYQNYVDRHFPKLPEKIGARVLPEDPAGMGGAGRGDFMSRGRSMGYEEYGPGMAAVATEADDDYVCQWLDQAFVRDELNFPQRPTAIRIWVTQENLWVYHSLLDVIANTNKAAGASRMSNAAVRTVYSLEVGQRAAPYSRTPGRVVPPPMAAPTGDPMAAGPEAAGPTAEVGPEAGAYGPREYGPGTTGAGPPTPEQENAMLMSYRYLGPDGLPIGAGGAAADPSLGGEPAPVVTDPAVGAPAAPIDLTAYGTEYKRLPVRMVLQMDQRWLPRLIAECASQPLQVEVQEVRINPPQAGDIQSSGMGGPMGGGMVGGPGGGYRGEGGGYSGYGGGGFGGGMGGAGLFPDRTGLQSFLHQPNVVNVVIQGVIYIFNKPNPAALQTSEEPQTAAL